MTPSPRSQVEIELLGVARFLARREQVILDLEAPTTLQQLLLRLADELPALVGTVLTAEGSFLAGHVLSRAGTDLLRDPEDPIAPGERLMLLSLSAGG